MRGLRSLEDRVEDTVSRQLTGMDVLSGLLVLLRHGR